MKKDKPEYKIPVEGNLGLLALGYRGVEAWRKVRDEALKTHSSKKPEDADRS